MLKYNKEDIKKILILKNDKIGDMVVSSGAFPIIRKAFPNAEITVIASQVNKSLIEKNPYMDKILLLDYNLRNFKELKDFLNMSSIIRKEKFDLGIDLRGSIHNIFFLLFLGRPRYKVGIYNRKFSRIFLDAGVLKDRSLGHHCVALRQEFLSKVLSLNAENYWPEIITDKADESDLKKVLKENRLKKDNYICLIPDASYPEKQWPFDEWNRLISLLKKDYPKYKIVITGGDLDKFKIFKNKNPDVRILKTHLRAAYLLFKNSKLVIAQDGGPMHMAWASKANNIAIIAKGRIPVHYFKPLGKNSITLAVDVKKLKAEEVMSRVRKFLNHS